MPSGLIASASLFSGWLLYPFTLGLVATVNPCGFPLLPIYLTLFIEGDSATPASRRERILRALGAGACATVGFAAVFGLLGLLSEAGLQGVYSQTSSWARWLMVAIGAGLVALGLLQLFKRHLYVRLPQLSPGLGLRRPLTLLVFGVSYAIASLGCSLPLFLGGIAGSFTRSGVWHGIATFLAYALGMGLLFTAAALLLAVAGTAGLRSLRRLTRIVEPVGAVALIIVGAYLLLYWIGALVDPTGATAPVRAIESVQGHIAAVLQTNAATVGWVLVGLLVSVGLLGAFRLRRMNLK